MQKSMQKKMIVLKTADSRSFEEVHLILRDHMESASTDNAIVEEANRIIAKAESCRVYRKSKKEPSPVRLRLGWFFGGIFTALFIVTLTALLCSLLF